MLSLNEKDPLAKNSLPIKSTFNEGQPELKGHAMFDKHVLQGCLNENENYFQLDKGKSFYYWMECMENTFRTSCQDMFRKHSDGDKKWIWKRDKVKSAKLQA